jgi:ribosome biogenesis GTPase / thiamine phosphate phosphatase
VTCDESEEELPLHAFPAGLGRRPELDAELAQLGEPDLTGARVLAQHRGAWVIATGGEPPRLAAARGRLRDDDAGPPVTGDWVAVDAAGAIAAVLERRGAIVRRAAGRPSRPQVLAANVDLALVAEPLPNPHERRAERLAALASAGGVPAALVLTKADLAEDAVERAARLARRLGLAHAVAVSTLAGRAGVGVLRTLLVPGATAVLLGPSGGGKSTLVNALLGEDRQATAAIRPSDGRGRHTTVARELIGLPTGGLLIDTPGIREAGLWEGAGDAFADIDALAAGCRFADCTHDGEPGCSVRGAVDPDRIAAWRKLQREQAWVDDRRAAARERERRGRSYSRIQREARRMKGG